jgi:hypothetical protein
MTALSTIGGLPSKPTSTTPTMPFGGQYLDQQQHQQQQEQDDSTQSVLFYVARLLYDPEFMSLVRTVENSVLSSHEGHQMLQDFNQSMTHLSSYPTNHNNNQNTNE